jgi:hypothetical protein
MANVYASSPEAQPADHTRIGASSGLPRAIGSSTSARR